MQFMNLCLTLNQFNLLYSVLTDEDGFPLSADASANELLKELQERVASMPSGEL